MNRGLFITFEGPDGAGKTTQLHLLANRLANMGIGYIVTREPGGTAISDQIRALLLDPQNEQMCSKTEVLLYAASRAQLVEEVIRPALLSGRVVLCDRYVDASIAYQGAGLGVNREQVTAVNAFATDSLAPDRTFLIDIDVTVGLSRVAQARRSEFVGLDRIEQRATKYHDRVRTAFLTLARQSPRRYAVLDGACPVGEIASDIWALVQENLPVKRS